LPIQSTTSTTGLAREFKKSNPGAPAMNMAGGSEFSVFTFFPFQSTAEESDRNALTD
jgi:hypothetical protein